MKYSIKLDWRIWSIILVFISLVSLYIRYSIMTEKFFFDSINLLSMIRLGGLFDGSFGVAARFFSFLNFFDIETLFGWSVYTSVIFFGINLWLICDIKYIEFRRFIFILLSIFLWYLFVAGITKEILQGLFYFAIYLICIKNDFFKRNTYRVVLGTIILLTSAIFFRGYYILTAFFSIVVFIAFMIIKKLRVQRGQVLLIYSALILAALILFLAISKIAFPAEYTRIINLRSESYRYLMDNTDTFIGNLYDNSSSDLIIYTINYCINYFRILLPFELLFIGKVYYFPFLIYQLMFSYYWYKKLQLVHDLNDKQLVSLVFISSFLIVAAMMEPDFGSWARHQCVILPLAVCCYIVSDNIPKLEKIDVVEYKGSHKYE